MLLVVLLMWFLVWFVCCVVDMCDVWVVVCDVW